MSSPEMGMGESEQKIPELTRERLADMLTLEVELRADFGPTLEAVRKITGADLQPRPEGYHLTIIGPSEKEVLSKLDEADIFELQKISKNIQNGEGVVVKGIGFIDGASSQYQMREVDKVKKTAFIALDIPALQELRAKIGLPPKDFHVTLGFVGGDIAMRIVGQTPIKPGSPKMKDVTALIPKQADPRFGDLPLPEITYGGLDGQMKQRK
jgi:hypothetical protein